MKIIDGRVWVVAFACLGMALVDGCSCSDDVKTPEPVKVAKPAPVKPLAKAPTQPPVALEEALERVVDLPPGFPEDAPVYPGAIANSSGVRNGRVHAVFSTADPTSDVLSWYLQETKANGWEDTAEIDVGEHKVLQAFKDSRELKIMISQAAGRSLIVVSVGL